MKNFSISRIIKVGANRLQDSSWDVAIVALLYIARDAGMIWSDKKTCCEGIML